MDWITNDWRQPFEPSTPSACGRCGITERRHLFRDPAYPFVWTSRGPVNLCPEYVFPRQEQILARMRLRRMGSRSFWWDLGISRDR